MLAMTARSITSTISNLSLPMMMATGYSSPLPSLRHSTLAIASIGSFGIDRHGNAIDVGIEKNTPGNPAGV
jgi:hypothetical protein